MMLEICQACLKIGDNVHPMTAEDVKKYCFVTNDTDRENLAICVYCACILRKLAKFVQQCRIANELLQNQSKKDVKLPSQVELSTSETKYYYVGPEESIDIVKQEDAINNEELDIPLVFLNENCDYEDYVEDVKLPSQVELSTSDTKYYYVGPEESIDIVKQEDVIKEDEDDIPLVFLSENCDYEDYVEDQTDIKLEIKDDFEETHTKRKKKKKNIKDGFTSRMVKETEEYIVIKLSKDQVLDEMQQHSQTEKYKVMPYKCEKCVRGFNFEDVLQKHMEKHSSNNGQFQCELCTQYCPTKVSLRGHLKSHSTRYKCKLCGIIRLSRQHVLEHYSLEHTRSAALYKCPQCDHTSNKRTAMQRHVRLHASSGPLKCDLCGKLYKSKESLRVHIMRHDDKKLHQCQVCTSSFLYATQLRKHMRTVHENKEYYCVECDIMFRSMDNLKQHLHRAKRHRDSSSYKYKCGQCPDKFISQSTLATHRTQAHGAVKSAACGACERRYSSGEALRWHVRRCHQPQQPRLPCTLCGKMFSRAYGLRVHMRTHTGERPHTCECGAAFTQPAGLKAHVVARHKTK